MKTTEEMLALREQQLAECTRAMREVARILDDTSNVAPLDEKELRFTMQRCAQDLLSARAGSHILFSDVPLYAPVAPKTTKPLCSCGHDFETHNNELSKNCRITECVCQEYGPFPPQPPTDDASFENRGRRIGALVDEKNAAYGDSFQRSGEIMSALYPHGIKVEQYRDALGVVRIIDKLFRIATRKNAFGENPFDDIAGYGIVAGGKEDAE